MRELLNTLYVQTQGAVLHLDNDTVRVEIERETRLRVPLLRLSGIVVFGQVTLTPFLIHRCAEDGRSLIWLSSFGRFRARLEGPIRGNVLLRRAQHLALSDPDRTWKIARQIVARRFRTAVRCCCARRERRRKSAMKRPCQARPQPWPMAFCACETAVTSTRSGVSKGRRPAPTSKSSGAWFW